MDFYNIFMIFVAIHQVAIYFCGIENSSWNTTLNNTLPQLKENHNLFVIRKDIRVSK